MTTEKKPPYRGKDTRPPQAKSGKGSYAPRSSSGSSSTYSPKPSGGSGGYAPRSSGGSSSNYSRKPSSGSSGGYAPRSSSGSSDGYTPRPPSSGYTPRPSAPKNGNGDWNEKPQYGGSNDKKPYRGKDNRTPLGKTGHGSYVARNAGGNSPRSSGGYSPRPSFNSPKTGKETWQEVDRTQQGMENYDSPNAVPAERQDELPFLIIGRNAVREAVKAGRSIDRVLVSKDPDGSLREILALARDRQLVIREMDRRKLDEISLPFGHGGKPANHQGILAYAAGVVYCDVSDILAVAHERGQEPFVVVLDGIEDPHNLGSILRSADCAGAHGVVIGKRRSAQVTAAAVKASAGASEHVKVARVTNINTALIELKRAGLWIAGADMSGVSMYKQGLNGSLALVIGGEGAGISKLVKDSCDFLVSIPMEGHIGSLNAGVAAAVLLFEKRRQDNEVIVSD